ncbi:DUF1295 domain-containing protein [Solimonas terrae]|uniref:DUF1295 domain-containing protein n=1 Tax=Solimonas terrae TaxID=1396819 RepID=A0A6M2BUT9_9GAMM|nr:DUF1295 domain-containing protein [Solimonas terrae]NGY05759.1 DUF1295 domain-containing protein [Solimonas terrae]
MFEFNLAAPMNWIYGVLVVLIPLIGVAEYRGWFQLEYSKFRPTQGGMSSRLGMFILYFVPIPVHLWFAAAYLGHATLAQWLLCAAMVGHFAKRCLEVLFLHKYSGPIGRFTVVQITLIYSLASALGGYLFAQAPALDGLFANGTLLFLIGEAGNYVHHKMLADLRARRSGYFIPQAGLFRLVTCPHYFFEIIAWVGIALMSHQWAMLLLALAMHNYLAARAWKTRQWYRSRFADYPPARKCMTPGLL